MSEWRAYLLSRTHRAVAAMAFPPTTRHLRSGTALDYDTEDIIEAVVARLTGAGLVAAAAATPVQPKTEREVVEVDAPPGPTPAQQQLWLADLREQLLASPNFGTREREEVRGLLIIGEGAEPSPCARFGSGDGSVCSSLSPMKAGRRR